MKRIVLSACLMCLCVGTLSAGGRKPIQRSNVLKEGGSIVLAKDAMSAFRVPGAPAGSPKIEGRLKSLQNRVTAETARRRATAGGPAAAGLGLADQSTPRLHQVSDVGEIQCYVIVDEVSEKNVDRLKALGMKVQLVVESINTVQGWVGCENLENIAAEDFVVRLQLPSYAFPRTGSVNTQGDALLNADDVRALGAPGPFTGSGVKVGIISDGVTNRASAIATGDLPATINLHPTLQGSGDEGTAMLEIVHDLAPSAGLYFGGPNTDAEMVSVINWMAATAGCNVICDDLGYYGQPYFEDGTIATAARNAVNTYGRVYVSAAGNDAEVHYQGTFVNGGGNFHDFRAGGGVDQGLDFYVPNGETVWFLLQWNDQFGASGNDYDLAIYDSTLTTLLASSGAEQNGNDDPFEACSYYNNTGSDVVVCAAVYLYSGSARTLEIFGLGYTYCSDDDAVPADSIFGHPAVTEVVSCAAINASDPGTDTIASYSSLGPSSIAFPSVQTRATPFITGIDGVSITGAGGFPNPFYGTSASAPHLAGVCALLLSEEPGATPTAIRAMLQLSATDRGSAGFDNTFGWGLADALKAVYPIVTGVNRQTPSTQVTNANQVVWRVTFNENVTGVDASDFVISVVSGSVAGYLVMNVSSVNGSTYDVTVNTGIGDGQLRLDILPGAQIWNAANNDYNSVYQAGQSYTIDKTWPSSVASTVDNTRVTSTPVDFSTTDSLSGVASTTLYVKGPSDVGFNPAGSLSGASGTFDYTSATMDGVCEFYTVATDVAGNSEPPPGAPDTTVTLNVVANSDFTQTVITGADTLVFPMTNPLDVTIRLNGASPGGTITVSRTTPLSAPVPGVFQHPDKLLDESLSIAGSALGGFTADLDWQYDLANTSGMGGTPINRVFRVESGLIAPSFAVTPSGNTLTVNGITGFSTWYAGNDSAVPVRVSGFGIE